MATILVLGAILVVVFISIAGATKRRRIRAGDLRMLTGVCTLALFASCVSQIASVQHSAGSWIGRPISDRLDIMSRPGGYADRIRWQQKTYALDNGDLVYIEPALPDCFIHWETNEAGTIIGFKTDGRGCN